MQSYLNLGCLGPEIIPISFKNSEDPWFAFDESYLTKIILPHAILLDLGFENKISCLIHSTNSWYPWFDIMKVVGRKLYYHSTIHPTMKCDMKIGRFWLKYLNKRLKQRRKQNPNKYIYWYSKKQSMYALLKKYNYIRIVNRF